MSIELRGLRTVRVHAAGRLGTRPRDLFSDFRRIFAILVMARAVDSQSGRSRRITGVRKLQAGAGIAALPAARFTISPRPFTLVRAPRARQRKEIAMSRLSRIVAAVGVRRVHGGLCHGCVDWSGEDQPGALCRPERDGPRHRHFVVGHSAGAVQDVSGRRWHGRDSRSCRGQP